MEIARMNKIALTAWLVAPIAVVAGLALAVDRQAARRSRDSSQAPSLVAAAERFASDAAAGRAQPAGVQPESLPQGFVLVVKDQTGLASASSPIFLASSHNGWNPGDDKQVLTARSDLRWQIVMPKPTNDSPIEFKFTRGSWDLEELDGELKAIANRKLPLLDPASITPGEPPIIEFTVVAWGDQKPDVSQRPDASPYYDLKVTGTVKRLQVAGGAVRHVRDLLVWLPPGYDAPENATRTYPVLYMQDGQNLFQQFPGTPAEWGADETATELITAGRVEPVIIVGIPHAGAARATEYTPIQLLDGATPRGGRYVSWLLSEVMPRVDRAFRTKRGPEFTAIGGSSFGAVIAMEAAAEHPDVFGKVLLESMSITRNNGAALAHFLAKPRFPSVVYWGMGGRELFDSGTPEQNARFVEGTEAFDKALAQRPEVKAKKFVVVPDAVHNETAWQARFGGALEFLFPASRGQ
ncbi:MAG: hypothetical protein C0468_00675 [Planctomyces sp.]|nr:hypothetical protein [Planctomyces sp.]MBA4119203.1 hypothetical protein [Isosphaera sp.]